MTHEMHQVIDLCCPKSAKYFLLHFLKGHAAPILYAAWAEAGLFPEKELFNLRKLSSDLEGHPTPVCVVI